MKKAMIISAIIILVVVVSFLAFYFLSTTPRYAGDFTIDEYRNYIENENFQTGKTYGEITDYQSAIKAGKTALTERFENANGGMFVWRGCSVKYDEKNDAYYVRTYQIFPPTKGGGLDVILKSDGTVIAIWGEK